MRVKKGYATRRGKIAVEDAAAYVRDLAQRLEARGRLGATRSFVQHGDVSVYDHVLAVAKTSICMARVLSRLGIVVDVCTPWCAARFCTITFSTTGTIPIRVIAFMGSGIRMPPCDVPKKILT